MLSTEVEVAVDIFSAFFGCLSSSGWSYRYVSVLLFSDACGSIHNLGRVETYRQPNTGPIKPPMPAIVSDQFSMRPIFPLSLYIFKPQLRKAKPRLEKLVVLGHAAGSPKPWLSSSISIWQRPGLQRKLVHVSSKAGPVCEPETPQRYESSCNIDLQRATVTCYSQVSAVAAVDDGVVRGRCRCYTSSPRCKTILANYSMKRLLLWSGGYRHIRATKSPDR